MEGWKSVGKRGSFKLLGVEGFEGSRVQMKATVRISAKVKNSKVCKKEAQTPNNDSAVAR